MFGLLPLSCCFLTFCKYLGSGSELNAHRIIFTLLIYLSSEESIVQVESLEKRSESENENWSLQCNKGHEKIYFLFCFCFFRSVSIKSEPNLWVCCLHSILHGFQNASEKSYFHQKDKFC